jgi:hypothetical protein
MHANELSGSLRRHRRERSREFSRADSDQTASANVSVHACAEEGDPPRTAEPRSDVFAQRNVFVSCPVFATLAIIDVGSRRIPAHQSSLFVAERVVTDEEPAILTVLPARSRATLNCRGSGLIGPQSVVRGSLASTSLGCSLCSSRLLVLLDALESFFKSGDQGSLTRRETVTTHDAPEIIAPLPWCPSYTAITSSEGLLVTKMMMSASEGWYTSVSLPHSG